MSDSYAVIKNTFTGEEWAVIEDQGRFTLYAPMHWGAPYESLGLRYYPGSGIDLPANPRRAWRKTCKHVAGIEKRQRKEAARVARARAFT